MFSRQRKTGFITKINYLMKIFNPNTDFVVEKNKVIFTKKSFNHFIEHLIRENPCCGHECCCNAPHLKKRLKLDKK